MARARRRPSVRVIVNTGAGKTFQTGLRHGPTSPKIRKRCANIRDEPDEPQLRLTGWHDGVSKPVIAAVNGTCAGGGLHFVADADIVLAASNASFLDAHVSVGQSLASVDRPGPQVPFEAVMRMALVGRHERLSARRALELGMVSDVVDPPEQLARRGPGTGREDHRATRRPPCAHQTSPVGCARIRSHRRLSSGRSRARVGVGSPRSVRRPRRLR